jgi:predicted negative regulator of RcsB-dependent stress response
MKTSERQHLKHDEVSETLQQAYARFDQNRSAVTTVLGVLIVVAAVVGGLYFYRSHQADEAARMLAEALTITEAQVVPPTQALPGQPAPPPPPAGSYPSERAKLEAAIPKFEATADQYSSTDAGRFARYRAGAALATLDRTAEARAQYQKLVDADGQGLYGRMAKLALAQCDVQDKKYDAAIATLRDLSLDAKGDLPVDAILLQLGQAYLAAGKMTEARQAFERVTNEFATSPYAADARKQLDALKG